MKSDPNKFLVLNDTILTHSLKFLKRMLSDSGRHDVSICKTLYYWVIGSGAEIEFHLMLVNTIGNSLSI